MRKNFILLVAFSWMTAFGIKAQTVYDLNQMTQAEFESGGNANWSFQNYDPSTGIYSSFPFMDNTCGINFWDLYGPERYSQELIGDPDPSNGSLSTQAKVYADKRNAWHIDFNATNFKDNNRFVYVGRNDKWGFETYSIMTKRSAIVFKVPADGYYKVNVNAQREDCFALPALRVVSRFRYHGETTVPDAVTTGFNAEYGADGATLYPSGTEFNGAITQFNIFKTPAPAVLEYYLHAKAGDMLAFELDVTKTNATSWARDAWARTLWKDLKLTSVDKGEAEAASNYCDPYKVGYEDAMNQAINDANDFLIGKNPGDDCYQCYPQKSITAVEDAIAAAGLALDNGTLTALNVQSYIDVINKAIQAMKEAQNLLDFEDPNNYRFIRFSTVLSEDDFKNKTYKGTSGIWNYQTYTPATGKYEDFKNVGTGSKYGTGAVAWYNGTGDWLYLTVDGNMHPLTTASPVVTFTAQKDAVYKVVASVKRAAATQNYYLWARFRYLPQGTTVLDKSASMGFDFKYGKQSSDTVRTTYYVKMKQGDKITFEEDAYTENAGNGSAGSQWKELYVLTENSDANALASGKYFNLYSGVVGDFTQLQALITESSQFLGAAVVGDAIGQFAQADKDVLSVAIDAAQSLVTTGTAHQYYIDIALSTLKTALTKFKTTMITRIDDSKESRKLPSGAYYIKSGSFYLTASATIADRKQVTLEPLISSTDKNCQVWNIQYNASFADPARYTVVSTIKGNTWVDDGIGHVSENGNFMDGNTATAASSTGANNTWRNFEIHFDGSKYCLWNVYKQWSLNVTTTDGTATTIATPNDKKYYLYTFVPYGTVGIGNESNDSYSVYGGESSISIVNANNNALVRIYDVTGVLVKTSVVNAAQTTIAVARQGVYLVKVTDENGSKITKVVVK